MKKIFLYLISLFKRKEFSSLPPSPSRCQKCGKNGVPDLEIVECELYTYTSEIEKVDIEYLCFEHAVEAGYCGGCGQFWAGATSFDFSEIPGFCENCVDQIKDNMSGDDDYDPEIDFGFTSDPFDPYFDPPRDV